MWSSTVDVGIRLEVNFEHRYVRLPLFFLKNTQDRLYTEQELNLSLHMVYSLQSVVTLTQPDSLIACTSSDRINLLYIRPFSVNL